MNPLENIWPEWQIEKQIGRGTYGTVYQAVRQESDLVSRAAIKVICIPQDPCELDSLKADGMDLQATRSYLKRIVEDFSNEIRLMVSLKGAPNIVSIEDYKVVEKQDDLGWDIYIRMELLTPLNTYICDKKLTEQDVIRLGCDICTALMTCSRNKIIHRDIKPENIFINRFGTFKLGDFGTARNMESLTGGLSQKGTFNYMAPEVLNGTTYDTRVDVYSLGLMLYRLMNGNRLPFLSEKQLLSPNERRTAFDRRMRGDNLPPPCNASPALSDVILKATAFRPEDRYGSAAELHKALMALTAEGRAEQETQQAFHCAEAAPTEPAVSEFAPKKSSRAAAKNRKPKSRKDSGPIRLNAPSMSIQAPQYRLDTSDTADKKKPRRPFLLVCKLLLAAAAIFVFLILPFLNIPVELGIIHWPTRRGYTWGDKLDTSGLQLYVRYRDGRTEYVENGFFCFPTNLKTAGTQEIQVFYWGKRASFDVEVVNTVKDISIETLPGKIDYAVGESLDSDGLVLKLHYSDGSTEQITSGFRCSPTSFDSVGAHEVTVSYKQLETSFPVNIIAPVELRVRSMPDKTTYKIGQFLNASGLELELVYSNGSSESITYGYTCRPNAFGRAGTIDVNVTYNGYETSFPVEVIKLESVNLISPPDNTEYYVGEAMNPTGIVLEEVYTDGSTVTVTPKVYCQYLYYNYYHSTEKLLVPGKIEVFAVYQGFYIPFYITVHEGERPEGGILETQPQEMMQQCDVLTLPDLAPREDDEPIDFSTMHTELSGWSNKETGVGFNRNGTAVNWCLWIELEVPKNLISSYNEVAVCSWGDVLSCLYSDITLDFDDAKNGYTFLQYGTYINHKDTPGTEKFIFMLMLPDDPSIEGEQTVTIAIGPYRKIIGVDLKYMGDYETGTGWKLERVVYEE